MIALLLVLSTASPAFGSPAFGDDPARVTFSEREIKRVRRHSPLDPPPADPTNRWADDPAAARFGQALFFDTRFSRNGEIACASCHLEEHGLADGRPLARGLADTERHAPSLWNAAYQRWFFWDGRADSLWAQAVQPFESDVEMGGDRMALARALRADRGYAETYAALFGPLPALDDEHLPAHARPLPDRPEHPDELAWRAMSEPEREAITGVFVNVAKSIAAYERRLVSRRAPFDVFVEGLVEGDDEKLAALSPAAQRGLKLFVGKANCVLCHSGPNFTDDEFHDLGIAPGHGGRRRDSGRHGGVAALLADPLNAAGRWSDAPDGAAARELGFLSRSPDAWGQFKTPSLRNVGRTAPYGHQGQFATLQDVVRFYSTLEGALPDHHGERVLTPLELSAGEMADLVAFLESLTDVAVDPDLLKAPE